jgi:hypothetical protein
MTRLTALLAALAVSLAACEFIIDTDSVRRNRGDGGSGGGTGMGGGNGGGGGGISTGGGGGMGYDGGAVCSGSMLPKLKCDPPQMLASGTGFLSGSMAAFDGGLLIAYQHDNAVQLDFVVPGGAQTSIINKTESAAVTGVRVSAEGSFWAFGYTTADSSNPAPIKCYTSKDPSTSVDAGANLPMADFGIAVDSNGDVVVARSGDPFGWGVSNNACPTTLNTFGMTYDYVSAVHIPGGGPENFRLVEVGGGINAAFVEIGIFGITADGGLTPRTSEGQFASMLGDSSLEVSLSSTGDTINATWTPYVDQMSNNELAVTGVPTNLAVTGGAEVVPFMGNVFSWSNSACGAGCLANLWTPYDGPTSNLSVAFTSDDGATSQLTSSIKGWDVTCGVPLDTTGVAAAYQGGRLHVLVLLTNSLKLYSCDVPPH